MMMAKDEAKKKLKKNISTRSNRMGGDWREKKSLQDIQTTSIASQFNEEFARCFCVSILLMP